MKWTSALLFTLSLNAQAADYKSKVPIPNIRPAGTGLNFVGNLVKNGYFFAEGTWTTTDLRDEGMLVAFPVNLAEVVCNRSWHDCLLTTTNISDNDWFTMHHESWHIKRWSETEIVAESSDQCVTSELTIKVLKETVFIVQREGGSSAEACAALRKNKYSSVEVPLTKPRIMTLQGPDQAIANDPRVKRAGK